MVRTKPCLGYGVLSNDRTHLDLDYVIEVEPISWLVDEENYRLISKYILLGGVSMQPIIDVNEVAFKDTHMHAYLYSVLNIEINPSTSSSHLLDKDQSLQDYFLNERKRQLVKRKK